MPAHDDATSQRQQQRDPADDAGDHQARPLPKFHGEESDERVIPAEEPASAREEERVELGEEGLPAH